MIKGLFVSSRGFLGDGKGGVQVCTREFIDCIKEAGISLTVLPVDSDRRWIARLLRLVSSSPFLRPFDQDVQFEIGRLADTTQFDFVFLNQEFLAPLARLIRPLLAPSCKIVVLSHGLEVVDLLHTIRFRHQPMLQARLRPSPAFLLGKTLIDEQRLREEIDIVCAISPFDADLEGWLGTKRSGWLPRTVTAAPLDWRPVSGRFGFVGTLDHAPNLVGLVQLLEAFEKAGSTIQIRVVGSPARLGEWLERRFPFVKFLGALDDSALDREASSWNAFIHPIFCLSRGCSTKLAQALAWQIPIVTTAHGRRGYVWRDGALLEATDPSHFAQLCLLLVDDAMQHQARMDVIKVASSSPSMSFVAGQMRDLLEISHE